MLAKQRKELTHIRFDITMDIEAIAQLLYNCWSTESFAQGVQDQ